MPTITPVLLNPKGGIREQEIWLWEGVANADTIVMLEMGFSYAHVMFQLRNTVPSSSLLSVVGGADNNAALAGPILNAGGAAITLATANQVKFLTGGVPGFIGFTMTGGTAGDMDVYMVRKFI